MKRAWKFTHGAALILATAIGFGGWAASVEANPVEPGFLLFSMPTAGNPLGIGLGTGWIGAPDLISDTSDAFPGTTMQNCGPRRLDFGDGNGCVGVGNTALVLERTQRMNDIGPSNHSILDIVALSLRSTGDIYYNGVNAGPGTLRILEGLDRVSPAPDKQIFGGDLIGNAGPTPCTPSGASPHSCMSILADRAFFSLSHRAALIFDSGRREPVDFNAHGFTFLHSHPAPDGMIALDGINLRLNGIDDANDQWPRPDLTGYGFAPFLPAVVPLPAGLVMLISALAMPFILFRRRAAA